MQLILISNGLCFTGFLNSLLSHYIFFTNCTSWIAVRQNRFLLKPQMERSEAQKWKVSRVKRSMPFVEFLMANLRREIWDSEGQNRVKTGKGSETEPKNPRKLINQMLIVRNHVFVKKERTVFTWMCIQRWGRWTNLNPISAGLLKVAWVCWGQNG